jgi:hypothetical protein
MSNSVLDDLVGKVISSIDYTSDGVDFTISDGEKFSYYCYGDCCANAYIESFDNVDWLLNQEIISVEDLFIKTEGGMCDCTDYHRYEISSRKGTASIEFRVSHN